MDASNEARRRAFRDRTAEREVRSEAEPPRIGAFLGRVRPGIVQQVGALEIVPLVIEGEPGPGYLLGPEALGRGLLWIGERGEGRVQQLEACNAGATPILVVEGETLVGAKQNRVVAHTVLVPPATTVELPVGCMERGRWDAGRAEFHSGALRMDPLSRSDSGRESREERRAGRPVSLCQERLWDEVARSLLQYRLESPSDDYHALLRGPGKRAGERAREFVRVRAQVGVIAVAEGELLGIELTGNPDTWSAIEHRTLPTYVLAAERNAASGEGRSCRPLARRPEGWLETLRQASARPHPAIGLGTDLELTGSGIAGWALWHEGSPAYLAVFAEPE